MNVSEEELLVCVIAASSPRVRVVGSRLLYLYPCLAGAKTTTPSNLVISDLYKTLSHFSVGTPSKKSSNSPHGGGIC